MYSGTCNLADSCDKLLKISVPYTTTGKKASPRIIVSFFDKDSQMVQSDYFIRNEKTFDLKAEIPEGTVVAEFQMFLYCFGDGSVTFSEPIIEITEKEPHRIVKVASAFIEKKGTFEDNLKNTLDVIEKASISAEKPNILCFTECVLDIACKEKLFIKEKGPELEKVCNTVKNTGMYVIFTSHEIDDEGYRYNTSFLISPKGEVIGKYRKVF